MLTTFLPMDFLLESHRAQASGGRAAQAAALGSGHPEAVNTAAGTDYERTCDKDGCALEYLPG